MDTMERIDTALKTALQASGSDACPRQLREALHYAVFPGGARIRPRLCLAVAQACEDAAPEIADAAAVAIELLHCASLVHDDLPCFDDAPTRRGKPSVHVAYGERLAVLSGDALIVLAFQVLAEKISLQPARVADLLRIIGRGVGLPGGIVAGQAWECEQQVDLSTYEREKTGSLFVAATTAGAIAAGANPLAWQRIGECFGEAFQVADDIHDVVGRKEELGKPTQRDAFLGRPNVALERGVAGAVALLKGLLREAVDSVPACQGRQPLRELILFEAEHFIPKDLLQVAA